jgi:hypothetical protein
MEEMRHAYKILSEYLKGINHVGGLSIRRRMMVKLNFVT